MPRTMANSDDDEENMHADYAGTLEKSIGRMRQAFAVLRMTRLENSR